MDVIPFPLNKDDEIFLNHGSHSHLPSISEESDFASYERQQILPVIVPAAAIPESNDQAAAVGWAMGENVEIMRLQTEVSSMSRYFIHHVKKSTVANGHCTFRTIELIYKKDHS